MHELDKDIPTPRPIHCFVPLFSPNLYTDALHVCIVSSFSSPSPSLSLGFSPKAFGALPSPSAPLIETGVSALEPVAFDSLSSTEPALLLSAPDVSAALDCPNVLFGALNVKPVLELPKGVGVFPNKLPEVEVEELPDPVPNIEAPPKMLGVVPNPEDAGFSDGVVAELTPNREGLEVELASPPKVNLEPLLAPGLPFSVVVKPAVLSELPKIEGFGVAAEAAGAEKVNGLDVEPLVVDVEPRTGLNPPELVDVDEELAGGNAEPPKPENDCGAAGGFGGETEDLSELTFPQSEEDPVVGAAVPEELDTPLTDGVDILPLASCSFWIFVLNSV